MTPDNTTDVADTFVFAARVYLATILMTSGGAV